MFEIKDGKLILDERSRRILGQQTIPPRYGMISPAMTALGVKPIRHKAITVDDMLERLTAGWPKLEP